MNKVFDSPCRSGSTVSRFRSALVLTVGLCACNCYLGPNSVLAQEPASPVTEDVSGEEVVVTADPQEPTTADSDSQTGSQSQGLETSADSGGNDGEEDSPLLPTIPAAMPDGRPLVPIGMFESQMDVLVPNDYRPVSLSQLQQAITRWLGKATGDQASRLKSAVYWVEVDGDMLVSDRSVIDIDSERDAVVRRSLGRSNLAISQTRSMLSNSDVLPRLETEADGDLVAVFQGNDTTRAGIEFQWQLRGEVSGTGYRFRMELPRTPQTRIVFSAPPNLSLRTEEGVLRTRPGPPPDASEFEKSRELRWYELDAGGLSSVTIHVENEQLVASKSNFVVRRSLIQYEADAGGLNWTSRMVVQATEGIPFPTLVVGGTTITSVKVNSSEIPFSSDIVGGRVRHLKLDPPEEVLQTDSTSLDVSVTGYTTWNDRNGWCDLPMPVWVGEGVIHASAVDDASLLVAAPLEVIEWQLPSDWKQSKPKVAESAAMVFAADGPPIATTFASDRSTGSSSTARTWSRVRFTERPAMDGSTTLLRLDFSTGSLQAEARIQISLDSDRVDPVRLRVEPTWSIQSLAFPASGRVLENPKVNAKGWVVVWPEAEDVVDSLLVIESKGSRVLPGGPSRLTIPATWFIRPIGLRGDLVAAVVPPDDLNWSGDAAMQRDRVTPNSLSEENQEYFAGVGPETLWFKPTAGRTPEVALQTPSVSFNARTLFEVRRLDDEMEESLEVQIESEGQSLKELIVQTGEAYSRGPFLWSISGGRATPTIGLPSSDVTELDGVYKIDVADKSLRDQTLLARRRYPIPESIEMQLPSVPGAASQTSDAIIGPGFVIGRKSSSVQLVPDFKAVEASEDAAEFQSSSEPEGTSLVLAESDNQTTIDLPPPATQANYRLRYDAVQQPTITLKRSDTNPNVTIVWREQVRVEASSRGADRIEAIYKVSPTAPFSISYGPELQLEFIERDGEAVDLMTVSQQPLVLEPRAETERIRVVWNRSQFGSNWSRSCRIPRISVSGTVLKSEYQLIAASDTFAPAALLRGEQSMPGAAAVISMRPGEEVTLVRRNIAIAIGWFASLLVFAACWSVAERSPAFIAGLIVLFTTALFLWWPWKLAVIGWLIIPAISAALLATSRHWDAGSKQPPTRRECGSTRNANTQDVSQDFSLQSVAKFMVWLIAVSFLLSTMVIAQEPSAPAEPIVPAGINAPVNVLVPMDGEGNVTDDIVYIPGADYAGLFQTETQTEPQDARIHSADYRVTLDPAQVVPGRTSGIVIEADYVIYLEDGDRSLNQVRLPIAANRVRRLELIDEVIRINRFAADQQGRLIATLPQGSSFRLRATLLAAVSQSEPWMRLRLTIPSVASCRLSVESDQNIDALRVGGRLLEESDLRRWTDELGPETELQIEYRTLADANDEASKALQRRYWIHAGKRQATVDCEVDPPGDFLAGETFQFVIRDAVIPQLTSPNWRFDRSDEYSPTRRLMTVTCIEDEPGPIRLLWTMPLTLEESDSDETDRSDERRNSEESGESGLAQKIRIPEVIAAALGENAPVWIALHCDTALQFESLDRDNTESISVDHFVAAWTGYRGQIDSAYVALRDFPSLMLRERKETPAQVTQQHHLHASADRLELSYSARLTPSDSMVQRYALRIPRAMELVQLTVNGQEIANRPMNAGDVRTVLLGSFAGDEEVAIEAVAVQRLTPNLRFSSPQFSPPRLTLSPEIETTDRYTISRARSTALTVLETPLKDVIRPQTSVTADSLAQGWIPVATWFIPAITELKGNTLGGLYAVRDKQTRFDCRQLILLDRDEDHWQMETVIRFANNRFPDFVDVEVPTRWCESLEVGPATVWSRQPSTDPLRQVIRIRCSREELGDRILTIRGRLQDGESARVSVPSVRVLGLGQRSIHLSLPQSLESEPVQWRTAAVEVVPLPKYWKSNTPESDRVTYQVANPSWSIDLAPLPEIDVDPVAVNHDIQAFTQNDGVLVVSHWDLFPGSLESVVIQLPKDAEVLGVWSAGHAVTADTTRSEADSGENLLQIPLTLSRLSQPLEVLFHVSAETAKQANYVPSLAGVPSTHQWLTNYGVATRPNVDREVIQQIQERGIAQARAVVEAVESLDMVAQRPRDEIAAWLRLWRMRYQMIAEAAGHKSDFAAEVDSSDTMMMDPFQLEFSQSGKLQSEERWRELDSRMAVFVQRFLGADQPMVEIASEPFLFSVGGFDGFTPLRTIKLTAADRPRPIQPASANDRGLRTMIVNGLTLMVIGGFLVCLSPFRRFLLPIVGHPAFWLALIGIFGFAVAPIPVAGAILLVAVSLPVFPSKRRSART